MKGQSRMCCDALQRRGGGKKTKKRGGREKQKKGGGYQDRRERRGFVRSPEDGRVRGNVRAEKG